MTALLSDRATVVGDTLPHRQGEGYERTILYRNWDDADPRRLARVQIRIDRSPINSFARVDLWIPATGWQFIVAVRPDAWWSLMPGYNRAHTHAAERLTLNLADELLDELIEIGI